MGQHIQQQQDLKTSKTMEHCTQVYPTAVKKKTELPKLEIYAFPVEKKKFNITKQKKQKKGTDRTYIYKCKV